MKIVRQPNHGTVATNGLVATYYAELGYVGPDNFAYAASDSGGYVDSAAVGIVSVTIGSFSTSLDSDGDGLPDLVEYALGTSPNLPTISNATVPTVATFGWVRYLSMTLPRFLPPADATLGIEVSADLQTWSPAAVVTNTSSLLQARDTISADAAAHRFIRLKVTRP